MEVLQMFIKENWKSYLALVVVAVAVVALVAYGEEFATAITVAFKL
jgi:hypothetical protein